MLTRSTYFVAHEYIRNRCKIHIKNLKRGRKGALTWVRLDCFWESFTTWLDNCEANADLDLVTDLANLANLLRPPENAEKYR